MCKLIHEYIERSAGNCPDRAAICFLDQQLTFAELDSAAARVARQLRDHGVSKGDRVGIFMDKSLNVPVAMYGIMKAGAAFVPLDPAAPAKRVAGVISHCGIRHILSSPAKRRALLAVAKFDTPVECVFGLEEEADWPWQVVPWSEIESTDSVDSLESYGDEDDLAYIIYTSGSTGAPKGIMHTHNSGLAFARWAATEYGLTSADRLSNHAPLHFDLSIFDYFAAAVAGAATVIIPEEYTRLPASYVQLLADANVSVLFTVPFALVQVLQHGAVEAYDLGRLRWAIFGGEPFPPKHLRQLMDKLPHVQFDNMYGPAEVNGVSHYAVPASFDGTSPVPIGCIANIAEALIVDESGETVQRGEPGELLVCTPSMMRGYWNMPELDERAFHKRTDGEVKKVFYRTGDVVVDDGDNILRFIGRMDRQVKVRGYRIELDEIERALTTFPAVEEAAAYALPAENGSKDLQAQITIKHHAEYIEADLGRHLKKQLPWYAIPSEILLAEEFPRTTTGKIDRRLLQEIASQNVN